MKRILGLAAIVLCTNIYATTTTIVTETQTWKPVPITVDSDKHTYVVSGSMPSSKHFYYSYPGYRCFSEKREIEGVNALVFNPSVSGGSDIYCYPEK